MREQRWMATLNNLNVNSIIRSLRELCSSVLIEILFLCHTLYLKFADCSGNVELVKNTSN